MKPGDTFDLNGQPYIVQRTTAPASEADREFQFTYRFGGCDWGITIFANDPAEAREKIKSVALARYDGEVAMKIPVPMGGVVLRAWRALIGR